MSWIRVNSKIITDQHQQPQKSHNQAEEELSHTTSASSFSTLVLPNMPTMFNISSNILVTCVPKGRVKHEFLLFTAENMGTYVVNQLRLITKANLLDLKEAWIVFIPILSQCMEFLYNSTYWEVNAL
ncbi:hypothetical protein EGR_02183 [Echinococcus granulosus]|uniref:Uncharacterized protein n=1 Tax=Echinococcus granulosus TaxID=6210 RepID=W6V953_ECHGR|nr:hypothetical protein EGR_02183 [Echinococcus granulosus]EUB63089.1 hypothetical protein EGR_02183 [Echinococcus granulosus]